MTDPRVPSDYIDLLECLEAAGADFIIVGGYAVMAHGHVRATSDLDVWIRPTPGNAAKVMSALEEFGLPPGLEAHTISAIHGPPPTGFRFGRKPIAVDLLTSIVGVDFDTAWADAELRELFSHRVRIMGLRSLLSNKRSTGRAKDAADVEALEAIHGLEEE